MRELLLLQERTPVERPNPEPELYEMVVAGRLALVLVVGGIPRVIRFLSR